MSESSVFPRQEALPAPMPVAGPVSGPAAAEDEGQDTGGVIASSLTVAIVTAGIGWYLVQEAVWQTHHLMASVISFFLLATLINILWNTHRVGHRFGEANQVTLLRSGLVCLIGSALMTAGQEPDTGWYLAGLITLALALDGVDGFLARRLNLSSDFGARFDMEIDALLLLILALLVWQSGQAGAWVLIIGFMRYAFVAASWIYPPLAGPLGPSFRRKTVCALQGIALLACLLPPLDQTEASVIALVALIALVISFGLDIRALLQGSVSLRTVGNEANT